MPVPGEIAPALSLEAEVYAALTLGVRDYVDKNGFPGVLLGSLGRHRFGAHAGDRGGRAGAGTRARGDDALAIHGEHEPRGRARRGRGARRALHRDRDQADLRRIHDARLAGEFKGLPADTTEENLQSRIRGTLLMALSNKSGAIVLTTGNKSEMGTGYATLYGDMAGGFAVLKDINKMMVYRLAELSQRHLAGDSAAGHRRARRRRNCGPIRPTRTACRHTTCSMRSWKPMSKHDISPAEIIARGLRAAPTWSGWCGWCA